jgi:hypothetical protein
MESTIFWDVTPCRVIEIYTIPWYSHETLNSYEVSKSEILADSRHKGIGETSDILSQFSPIQIKKIIIAHIYLLFHMLINCSCHVDFLTKMCHACFVYWRLTKPLHFFILNCILVSHQTPDIFFIKLKPVLGFFRATQAVTRSPRWGSKLTANKHAIRWIPSTRNLCATGTTAPSRSFSLHRTRFYEGVNFSSPHMLTPFSIIQTI